MSLRNSIDIVLDKEDLIQLKNGKVKSIKKIFYFDDYPMTINIFVGV